MTVFIVVNQKEFTIDVRGVYSSYERALESCLDRKEGFDLRRDILVRGVDGKSEEKFYYLAIDGEGSVMEEDKVEGDFRVVDALEFDYYTTEVLGVKALAKSRGEALDLAERILAAAEKLTGGDRGDQEN